MDQRLNWSLVLLVFILASHITDVLARHHHIKFRHARHRRQHGESYLPASFVSDTDENESGTWGPWSAPSSCSRSCGGGVAHQTRTCQDIDEVTHSELCTGARNRFFSCNVQECPEPTQDFRAEQCAEFNNVPIEGVYYDWIPYTGGPNKCELNCMPRGQRFFYRHRPSVTDGTPCTAEKNDVCVQGKCRPVGCDMMLGSDAKEDRCRECGGDGSACNTIRGLLDMNDLQVGYNDILLIPEGATNIAISEVRPSSNYLAIRNASGHYYLNGNWRIDFPRSLRFAGSVFHYERRPKEFSAADIINALGPTSEAIYIVLLYQDTNVGVNYEYSVTQKFAKQSNPDTYTWVVEEFSNCSVECGGGIQSRLVRCVKRGDNEEADASLCDQQLEPDSTQACNVEACPPEWVIKGWGPCSKQCGPGGEQSREIQCEQVIAGGIPSLVDDHQCLEMIGPKDIQIQECNRDVECPQWHIGPWKPCDRLCGKGKQTRKITCYKKEEGKIFVLDDSACEEKRPESDKPCELRPCAGVDWVVSKWSGCDDNCGLTRETRTTSCVTLDGDVYPDSQCNAETKPKLVRECSAQEKCAFQWYATQWSECSAKCGTGVQTRKVFCGTSPGSGGIKEVDDGKCDPAKKYNTTKDCTAEIEECKGEWFAGPWTECSKPCGGGEMTRKVICMKDNQVVPVEGNCYDNDIMFSIEDCNKEACNEDETIPLEPGNMNASIEDDEVECEDYQDDGFLPVDSNLDTVDPEGNDGKLPGYGLEDLMLGDDSRIPSDEATQGSGDGDGEGSGSSTIDDYDLEGSGSESTSESTSSFSTSETESTESPETDSTDTTESTITDSTSSETSATPKASTPSTPLTTKPTTKAKQSIAFIKFEDFLPDPTTVPPPKTTGSHSTVEPGFTSEFTSEFETSASLSTGETSETSTVFSSEGTGSTTDSESTAETESTESPETTDTSQTGSTDTTESKESGSSSSIGTDSTSSETLVTSESSVSTDTSSGSSSDTTVLPSSETSGSSSSDTTESSGSDATVSSSSEKPGSTSSDTTVLSSSETPESSSSDTTESSSSDTTQSSRSDTTEQSSSDATIISSSDTTVLSSSNTPESSSSETTEQSSSDTTISSSSDTTVSSGSDTTESSSSDTTVLSSSNTPGLSSSDTTESSSSDTTEESSSDTTILSGSDTTESSSSDTTESSSSDTTVLSSSEAPESSSSDTTESSGASTIQSSSSETPGLSSSDTTESSSSATTQSSSSEISASSGSDTTESSSSVTTGSSSSDTTDTSSAGTTQSSSSATVESFSSVTTESSSSETSGSSSSVSTESSSSGTTQSSSSETSGSSSLATTESSSSETSVSSSSDTTESSSSDTTELSSLGVTVSSSSETPGSSSSATTESSSSETSGSSSSETTESSSSDTTAFSSSDTTESSSLDTTVSASSETTGSSSSTETTGSSSSETTVLSSSDTTASGSSFGSTATTESSSSTDITEETSESEFTSDITTEIGATGETTESGITETDEDLDTTEQSHITDIWTTSSATSTKRPRKCRPRKPKTCKSSPFGCCYDGVKAAKGPFGKGCPVPKTCKETEFGCCPDEVSPATGPDNEGCPVFDCNETLFGCCPDNVTPSEGNDYEGCPIPCNKSEYGCCPDEKTPASGKDYLGCCNATTYGCCPDGIESASGPDGEGCEEKETSTITTSESEITSESSSTVELTSTSEGEDTTTSEVETTTTSETEVTPISGTEEGCTNTPFGCCPDNKTAAVGENFEGCGVIKTENCTASYYGCCPDGVSPALGENGQGCPAACEDSIFGCCDDGSTPAHGPNKEGCCLATPYGCCPDNIRHVQGPNLYGCGCQYSRYGCCPDNKTTAGGPNNEGCACEHTPHGCCPNRIAAASGPNFEGCGCHTYQFGCCPDGISVARGPQQLGCGCENSEFKCCSDGITPAKGENYAGCTCDSSKYGCCPDGNEEAQGENFEGCLAVPSNPGAACALKEDRGTTCAEFTVRWFFDTEYGGCSRFWYGGCDGNENRFKNREECNQICVEPKGRDACFLPKIQGPCEEYHPMWYYDSDRKQCGQFVYKGCLGNANKFKTREDCESLCDIPDDVDPCEQAKEVGPCEGNFTRWYFNKETDSCEEFSYGGCKGNKNNFRTQISCHQQCLPAGQSRVQDVCALEKEPGPCPGSLLRWYYDSKRKSCRQFVFGGCKGNGNKFRTYAACEQRCPIRDSCALPRQEGSCTEKHARWFFDQSEQRCLPFYYTGCGGNKNNYETRDACDSDCPPKIEQETCLLPALLGDCYNYTKRWYYDSYEERCRQFYYGGCGGNGNNFETEDHCTNRCRPSPTTRPPTIAPTRAPPAITTPPPAREFRTESCFLGEDYGPCDEDSVKWFYDSRDGICKQFRYGGCGGNGNKFDTPEECENRCGNVQDLCGLPAVVGPCRAAIPKYYYDSRTDSCYEFVYGGCQGNKNNFYDKVSCEQRCKKSAETTTKIVSTTPPATVGAPKSPTCSLPRDPGPCDNDITAYFYDERSGACQAFVYGGCEGNANRFQTEEQCERLCGSFQGQDVCNIPSDPGPCLGAFRKFYYDPNTRGCHEFLYGGCDGNANRFTSAEECESVCVHREEPPVPGNRTAVSDTEICNEPVSVGSCSPGSFKRFYYSDERLNCIAFIYTGCGGNRNRFKTYDSCMRTCYSPINEVDVGPHEPEPKDPCLAATIECNTIRCPYGTEDYVDEQNCQHCRCADPCRTEICPEGSKCAITLVAEGDFTGYRSVCRSILKEGSCPKVSNASRCEQECSSDADCSGDLKCCASGCGTSCLKPAPTEPITTPKPDVGFPIPYPGAEAATIKEPEEPNVHAEEGGHVILPCACSGNPRPTITWRRGVTLIDNSLERHSINVEGSLHIVNLYTTDAGIYTCTADNRLATPVRIQYELYITGPQKHSPVILGEPNYRVTVTLNSPAVLPCNAIGWPRPQITWWHEKRLLPMSRGLYALQRDNSLRIHRVDLSNLGVYTCQAFNGIDRPTSWSVTLLAPGPVYNLSPENQKYAQYLIEPPKRPVSSTARPQYPPRPETTQAPKTRTRAPFIPDRRPYVPPVVTLPPPKILPGPRIEPVRVNVSAEKGKFPERSEFNISCNVEGFPVPRVVWSKDDVPIQLNNRITILHDNTLIISNAEKSDSGRYRCQAGNEYSTAEDSVDIEVAGISIHPSCTDTQFYARCDLIVKANFCHHKYYARFCCRSCTEAGQLPARGPHINETRRKRRSILSFL